MTFVSCLARHLFAVCDILAFAGAAVCGLWSPASPADPAACTLASSLSWLGFPGCQNRRDAGSSRAPRHQQHRAASSGSRLVQSCLASDKDSLCVCTHGSLRPLVCLHACLFVSRGGFLGVIQRWRERLSCEVWSCAADSVPSITVSLYLICSRARCKQQKKKKSLQLASGAIIPRDTGGASCQTGCAPTCQRSV